MYNTPARSLPSQLTYFSFLLPFPLQSAGVPQGQATLIGAGVGLAALAVIYSISVDRMVRLSLCDFRALCATLRTERCTVLRTDRCTALRTLRAERCAAHPAEAGSCAAHPATQSPHLNFPSPSLTPRAMLQRRPLPVNRPTFSDPHNSGAH